MAITTNIKQVEKIEIAERMIADGKRALQLAIEDRFPLGQRVEVTIGRVYTCTVVGYGEPWVLKLMIMYANGDIGGKLLRTYAKVKLVE